MSNLKTLFNKKPTKAKVQELKWKATISRASLPSALPEDVIISNPLKSRLKERRKTDSDVLDVENFNIVTLDKEIDEYSKRKKKHKKKCKKVNCSRVENELDDSLKDFETPKKELNKSVSKEKKPLKESKKSNGINKITDMFKKEVVRQEAKPKPKNAFSIMMKARHNVIGLNTDGKDRSESSSSEDETKKTKLKERKKMLVKWAEKKGSKKRKLQEEVREEYVADVLEKRAKKLKQMIESPKIEKKKTRLRRGITNGTDVEDSGTEVQKELKVEEPTRRLRKRDTSMKYADLADETEKLVDNDSEVEVILEVKPVKKLAPLFSRRKVDKTSKEYLDKQKFLQSGMPDECIKLQEKQKEYENFEYAIFPSISHVRQIEKNSETSFIWNLPKIENYPPKLDSELINPTELKLGTFTRLTPIPELSITPSKKMKATKTLLKKLKDQHPDFPVMTIYRNLVKRKESEHAMWTEKYRPLHTKEILRNTKSVNELKTWISGWMRKKSENYDSDFEGSDSRDSSQTKVNTMVLVGPCGSGKTSAVYAIANELNVNVLEINASSFRSGKRILNDIHEATQSQHFREEDRFSLILIEDIDIVYTTTDDGFLNAVNNLISSGKRPVILTSSDLFSSTTQKYISTYRSLKFHTCSPQNLIPMLQIIGIIEENPTESEYIERLFHSLSGDLRKILLHLQLGENGIPLDVAECKEVLGEIVDVMDNLALVDIAERKVLNNAWGNPGKCLWRSEFTHFSDSLATEECMSGYCGTKDGIRDWILEMRSKRIPNLSEENNRSKSKLQTLYSHLLDGISLTAYLGPRNLGLDYYPTLRSINLSEQNRASENRKRSNRFTNYLRTLHINCNEAQSEALSKTFRT